MRARCRRRDRKRASPSLCSDSHHVTTLYSRLKQRKILPDSQCPPTAYTEKYNGSENYPALGLEEHGAPTWRLRSIRLSRPIFARQPSYVTRAATASAIDTVPTIVSGTGCRGRFPWKGNIPWRRERVRATTNFPREEDVKTSRNEE